MAIHKRKGNSILCTGSLVIKVNTDIALYKWDEVNCPDCLAKRVLSPDQLKIKKLKDIIKGIEGVIDNNGLRECEHYAITADCMGCELDILLAKVDL